jgi:hypothetical protein
MTLRRRLLAILLGLSAAPALAQPVASSPAPDAVAVTIYRDPNRPAAQPLNRDWLNGYALVSETRRVTIPAGESQIRFEGVAAGIIPQSAIVTGLPEGIVERNRDAYLLSPGTLLDRSLGQRVHLRRTSRATGEVREHDAVIRSTNEGAVVLQTAEGFESLRCTGIPETLIYDRVPAELSIKPTLSIRARSSQPITATVTLSYLATGFDWQANYIGYLSPDEDRVDLFAWLTLASTDETSFVQANAQAVAGKLNREHVQVPPVEASPLNIQCWPQGTTSDIPIDRYGESRAEEDIVVTGSRVAFAPPAPPPPPAMMEAASLAVMVGQEELGDLKLYRIPIPVTVAANAQKQVALLQRPRVEADIVYRQWIHPGGGMPQPVATRMLVTRNRAQEGLGLPLPAGQMVLFQSGQERPILIGEGFVDDRAVGEDVEIRIGPATAVRTTLTEESRQEGRTTYLLSVSNDRSVPIRFEAEIDNAGAAPESDVGLVPRNGRYLWAVTIPANGTASLRYATPPR